jgi:hypothetical protein
VRKAPPIRCWNVSFVNSPGQAGGLEDRRSRRTISSRETVRAEDGEARSGQ